METHRLNVSATQIKKMKIEEYIVRLFDYIEEKNADMKGSGVSKVNRYNAIKKALREVYANEIKEMYDQKD